MQTFELVPLGATRGTIVYSAPQREAKRLAALLDQPIVVWRVTTKRPVNLMTVFADGSIAKERTLHQCPRLSV